ncbi:molybdopterin-dependent oxidoreductase [Svornostia abyssi]|uniref:Molybdopterin-dependent oxidoreductase n=1 Tax=Svornostia abyssi TaxID=2898438 RepID=A0ABY5PJL1_9ACTN|nr:molybdopterin-dependent oxidoreductase [Parviterribacteraceae bacterium J379]
MAEELPTYCRICEPLCGMVATVDDGKLVQLRPDREHPVSKGFACPKGIAFTEVVNDPDRVTHPLRRRPDGTFERVSWDDAMRDIKARLLRIQGEHGSDAIGWYWGNPGAFSASHTLWVAAFMLGLRSPHLYTAGSQDVNNRFAASEFLYGNTAVAPVPDLHRADLVVIVGANPLVSHGSVLTAPRIKEELHGVVERGGRVVVVDPRRTETARAFEWQPIRPDGDAFMLLSLLHVLFEEGLADEDAIARQARGAGHLRDLARPFSPEATAATTGIAPEAVRELARALATTERAAMYGRIGTSLGRSGTLTTMLLDAVNLVAGNLDREGGSMFGSLGVPLERTAMQITKALIPVGHDRGPRSRIGDFPSILASRPAAIMAKEMTTPGKGRLRALFVSAGNPVLSCPNGEELEAALDTLDLHVGIDFYVNETNAHADYVLPATTMYEREDFPIPFQALSLTPFRQGTKAVIPPVGEAREEWEVIDELASALWRRTPAFFAAELLRRTGTLTPRRAMDAVVRLSEGGDLFGLRRGGLTFKKLLRDFPHGKVIAPHLRAGALGNVVLHRDRKVHLDAPQFASEIDRLGERIDDPAFPLRLIGMRELRSENSWMHNAPLLLRGGRKHLARLHPDDAADIGAAEGDRIRVASAHGEIEIAVTLTDDLMRGVIAIPHGWGHKGRGGWQRANTADDGTGGANVNQLMSSDPADLEPVVGMANLTGVPVRAEVVAAAQAPEREAATLGA